VSGEPLEQHTKKRIPWKEVVGGGWWVVGGVVGHQHTRRGWRWRWQEERMAVELRREERRKRKRKRKRGREEEEEERGGLTGAGVAGEKDRSKVGGFVQSEESWSGLDAMLGWWVGGNTLHPHTR